MPLSEKAMTTLRKSEVSLLQQVSLGTKWTLSLVRGHSLDLHCINNVHECRVWFERLESSPNHISRATPVRRSSKVERGEDGGCDHDQVRIHVDGFRPEFWLVCAIHGF